MLWFMFTVFFVKLAVNLWEKCRKTVSENQKFPGEVSGLDSL